MVQHGKRAVVFSILAGLSGAAAAQSAITLYGVADATFDVIHVTDGKTTANNPSFNRVSSNGSRLGFKGAENLGNGLTAIFQFESNANFDKGGALDTNRDNFVGIASPWGVFVLGNATGPTRALAEAVDVNVDSDGIASNRAIVGKLGGVFDDGKIRTGTRSGPSMWDVRFKNGIGYMSPVFSGLQVILSWQTPEDKTETPGTRFRPIAFDSGVKYVNGRWLAGVGYGKLSERNETGFPGLGPGGLAGLGMDEKLDELRVAGKYEGDQFSVRGLFGQATAKGSLGKIKQNTWGVGATYQVMANGKLTSQYYRARDISGSAVGAATSSYLSGEDTGAKFYSVGFEYSLSKRTLLKAHYAALRNDAKTGTNTSGRGGYDFGNGYASENSGVTIGDDVKLSGFQFGIRHTF